MDNMIPPHETQAQFNKRMAETDAKLKGWVISIFLFVIACVGYLYYYLHRFLTNRYGRQKAFLYEAVMAVILVAVGMTYYQLRYYDMGDYYMKAHLYSRAIAYYSKQLDVKPEARIYANRALAYLDKGDYQKSIQDSTKAIDLAPWVSIPYNQRAWAYHLAGNDAGGLPDANKALKIEPKNPDILETRAEIFEKLGKREEAIADYRTTLHFCTKGSSAEELANAGLKRLGAQ